MNITVENTHPGMNSFVEDRAQTASNWKKIFTAINWILLGKIDAHKQMETQEPIIASQKVQYILLQHFTLHYIT